MRLVEESPTLLILEERPLVLGSLLGFFFVASAWGLIVNFGSLGFFLRLLMLIWLGALVVYAARALRWVRVTFDAPANRVTIDRLGFSGPAQEEYALHRVSALKLCTGTQEGRETADLALAFEREVPSASPAGLSSPPQSGEQGPAEVFLIRYKGTERERLSNLARHTNHWLVFARSVIV